MTKQEQNQIIKDAWVRGLQTPDNIPEDIANTYSKWLQGVIAQATPQLTGQTTQTQQGQAPEEASGQEQEQQQSA